MEKKNFFWWVVFILLCIWQLPQLLVALVMMLFLGKRKKVADRHFNFCYECENMMGGISLGPLSFVSPTCALYQEDIAHEVDGHTVQSKWLGPLYVLVIGLSSLIHAWLYNPKKSCYYDFYTEKTANFFAKLEVDKNCRLQFKK